jgi:hypothetical protein
MTDWEHPELMANQDSLLRITGWAGFNCKITFFMDKVLKPLYHNAEYMPTTAL